MSVILLISILVRLVGVAYSVVLLYQSGDRRFGFLTVMLALMASRQLWTLIAAGGTGFDELPGLVVSFLALATVHYLSQYVEEETRIKEELKAANDRLRSFREAVEHAGHAIFLTDPDGTIEYANPAVEDVTGYKPSEAVGENPRLWKSGEHSDEFYETMWKTITSGETWKSEIVNERKDGTLCWVDMTIAPIASGTGDIEQFVAVDTDVTERKKRELRINKQNRRLELLNTTNEVIRDVNRELVQADTPQEIETVACEQFAGAAPYESAWFATRNMVTDTVRARTGVGLDNSDLETIVAAINDADHETVVDRALSTNTTQISRATDDTPTVSDGDDTADGCVCYTCIDAAVTIAIPLTYRDAQYGALVVHASESEAADDLEITVLNEVGETIAYSLNAAESKQSLVSDRVTMLAFELGPDDEPLVSLATTLDSDLELERVSTRADGSLVEYIRLDGVPAATAAESAAETFDEIEIVQEMDDGCLIEVTAPETSIVATITEYGGIVRTMTADDQGGNLVVELSSGADVRAVVEAVFERHPGVALVGQHEQDREPDTRGQFRATIEESLTERQFEAVQMAYFGGYFEWPRNSSGEDLAERMGVTQSTYLQHLRAGQQKFYSAFFQTDDGVGRHRMRA
ncbi:bacterio-opsin activator domain-containing protein [Halalkaliarchaeum sp. AArc-GB]|uniref:bacterio-opsin activator domain-containing protein n=2 Tax=unclassified Halalkaliarchaeum TaxID=2678344 RepID=UPI0028578DA6|nr:bacterio-opsin activator domain-containing protein [Halalkaliarchaeum sp. AArc-GB]MDR5672624.1 bacterio-opsin activator domain-containing protein [Halalkaliarchaeum sp. AArc-GB]